MTKMIEIQYTKHFPAMARTLSHTYIGDNDSGWIITGTIHEDYYRWVNEFKAYHPAKNWHIEGDFETAVRATNKEALSHFLEHHPFEEWDYMDI
jgi:hypothetical protein